MSNYLQMNPLAEHNANIAMSSKEVPITGTGNLYGGVGGRTFTQGGGGGGGGGLYYGPNLGVPGTEYARGTYSPVAIGNNANASSPASVKFSGGSSSRKRKMTKRKNRKYSRSRKHSMLKSRKMKSLRRKLIMRKYKQQQQQRRQQHGGAAAGGEMVVGWGAANGSSVPSGPNAAYSVGGTVTPQTTALANPAQITAYNSCAASGK
jgi:hypothetical protein